MWSYLCVRDSDFVISTVLLLDFGTIATVWYFLFLISLVADAMFYLCYGY